MRADIDRALEGRPVHAPAVYAAGAETEHFLPPPPNDAAPTAVVPPVSHVSHREEPPPPRRTWLWVLLLLLLAAAVIAALIVVPKLLADDGPTKVNVPKIIGMTVDEARTAVEQEGLQLGRQTTVTTGGKRNTIIHQAPFPDASVDEGTAVDYTVVVPPKKVPVPPVTDGNLADAEAALQDAGLVPEPHADQTSTERKNEVTTTDPPPGTLVKVGSTVKVFYSAGYIEVKNVVGLDEDTAKQILEGDHFKVFTSDVQSDAPAGTVTAQDPEGGTKQPYGSTVVISVSLGPTTSTEPTEPTDTVTTSTPTTPTALTPPTPTDRRLATRPRGIPGPPGR
jgi:serine/threonine-protein kinase